MGILIALLRGVNVGGIALKMEDFRKILEYIGCRKVKTFIQSGNAVFEHAESNKRKIEAEIAFELKNIAGVSTVVIVLSKEELKAVVEAHPLSALGDEGSLYITILAHEPASEDVEALMETMNEVDKHIVKHRIVYSYYGNGYGTSKRSNNFIEKMLKVSATTRSWNTMKKIMQLCDER
jgi:uncharacterized protein (DUF1697 family)